MKANQMLSLSALTLALSVSSAYAAESQVLTQIQKKEVEQVIHDYLVGNPDVLIEASQALQKKQQEALQAQAKSAISQHADSLVKGSLTVAGNPKGNVTLVEFFDYQCIHCIKMKPVVSELIQKNANLRVVYKEFPIFGKESEMASRVAIAAAMQGKYLDVQTALFKADHHLNEKKIMTIAKQAGLNMETLKKDMNSAPVSALLDDSRKLAEAIHLMGTPAFVVLSTPNGQFKTGTETAFIPGAASEATLQDLIKNAAKQ